MSEVGTADTSESTKDSSKQTNNTDLASTDNVVDGTMEQGNIEEALMNDVSYGQKEYTDEDEDDQSDERSDSEP